MPSLTSPVTWTGSSIVRSFLRRSHCNSRSFSFTSHSRFPRISESHVGGLPPNPSFREQVARANGVKSFSQQVRHPSIRNQVFFFLFGSFVAYSLAAKQTNNDTAYWTHRLSETGSLIFKTRPPTSDEMRRARYYDLGKRLQSGLATVKDVVEEWPNTIKSIGVWVYVQVAQPILDTTEGRRVCWAIGAFNGLTWLAWQFPQLKPVMMRSFTHNPLSGLSYTLLTSAFSHKSLLHWVFNSMALASFGSAASQWMTKEQSQSQSGLREPAVKWHFLAFFISAGLFSGLVSHVIAARFRFPQLVSKLTLGPSTHPVSSTATAIRAATNAPTAAASTSILPSLGASGAIYATVTLTALAFPDTEIALLIPPTFPIPIQWGVGGLVAIDILGVLRGWRMFDHWAHLGGAAFGVWYYNYGMRVWDFFRVANLGVPPSTVKEKDS